MAIRQPFLRKTSYPHINRYPQRRKKKVAKKKEEITITMF